MAKTKISQYDVVASNNTDVDGVNLAEGCSPSGINNAIREIMAHLKDFQAGLSGDTLPVASGGTGSTTAGGARTALGSASSGANSDITSITGLTTALSVAQGGTGATSITANSVVLGNGTGTVQEVAPGASGNALVSNGTTWQSTILETIPAGAVQYFAMNTAPTGWLKANGQAVSRTTYATLFSAIGTTFGSGDGSTTFNVPDLRGEFLRGWDDSRGIDSGRAFGSWQTQNTNKEEISMTTGSNGSSPITAPNEDGSTYSAWLTSGRNDGGSRAIILRMDNTETRPRNFALLACIKS